MTNDTNDTNANKADEVLAFWFGEGDDQGKRREQWFKKDDAYDQEIRQRFLATYEIAAAGNLANWKNAARPCLALIVVLDQFPRNMFRGSHRAFATDAMALDAARHALFSRFDTTLKPVERQFIYLPFEHSESLADQQQCLQLMLQLSEFAETRDLHIWAEKHLAIIQRFGRFPHRNVALGRESTPEELEFLKQPGSGF